MLRGFKSMQMAAGRCESSALVWTHLCTLRLSSQWVLFARRDKREMRRLLRYLGIPRTKVKLISLFKHRSHGLTLSKETIAHILRAHVRA